MKYTVLRVSETKGVDEVGLQKLIDEKGMTNYRVAKLAGVGQATISQLTTGKRKEPKLSTAAKIAEVLEVEIEDIYKAVREES